MDQVRTAISDLSIAEPTFRGGLTVFPLTATEDRRTLDYLRLAEGLEEGLVSVREVSEGGSVPDLAVENRADLPVLIVDGEELVGAKQNRVANLTLLVAAGKTTIIPVSCVEARRWSYDRPDFRVSDRMHYASGRAERYRSVQDSMRRTGTRRSDQGRVWSSIDDMAAATDAESETGAMSAIFDRHEKALNDYVRDVTPVAGQVGAIFAVADRRWGLDVFDRPGTLAAFLPKLVQSYAVDALDPGLAAAGGQVRERDPYADEPAPLAGGAQLPRAAARRVVRRLRRRGSRPRRGHHGRPGDRRRACGGRRHRAPDGVFGPAQPPRPPRRRARVRELPPAARRPPPTPRPGGGVTRGSCRPRSGIVSQLP